jgi:ADP-ribose pyrophosphatase YjhB (NUDIX family)
VKEETGLIVKDIIYKGLEENCDPNQRVRHMIFNYLATSFEGNTAGPSGGRIVMGGQGPGFEFAHAELV